MTTPAPTAESAAWPEDAVLLRASLDHNPRRGDGVLVNADLVARAMRALVGHATVHAECGMGPRELLKNMTGARAALAALSAQLVRSASEWEAERDTLSARVATLTEALGKAEADAATLLAVNVQLRSFANEVRCSGSQQHVLQGHAAYVLSRVDAMEAAAIKAGTP